MNRHFVLRERCPACGSPGGREIYRSRLDDHPLRTYLDSFYSPQGCVEHEYLVGQEYLLDWCAECGLVYQREIPNEELMGRVYEKWIDPVKVFALRESARPFSYYRDLADQVAAAVRYLNKPPAELLFLDYGMGWGNFCRMARAHGLECHGAEFSRPRIEYAVKTGVTVIGPGDLAKHLYDFINVNQVMEHLAKPADVLSALAGSLASRGLIRISVPDGRGIREKLAIPDWAADKKSAQSLNPVAPLEHVNCFDREALLNFAGRFGLRPVDPAASLEGVSASLGSKAKGVLRSMNRLLMGARPGDTTIYFAKVGQGER